ncbi:uncharacterized protein LOC134514805 isoform X2 [Chroicocephalus ridibundus]|uniref:uncharacterized protein LOC134514805 isoform X2 n=1 Tax=Chroicocephalus ridibundus TaxID=1192867 RepID=UPI002FDCAF9B
MRPSVNARSSVLNGLCLQASCSPVFWKWASFRCPGAMPVNWAPNLGCARQHSHPSCLWLCSSSSSCSWRSFPCISFDVAVGSEPVPSCLLHKQPSAAFATAGNELSCPPAHPDLSLVCHLAHPYAFATRSQATSAKGESGVGQGHPLVPSTKTCAGAAAPEANGARLHLLLGRLFPLWGKGADELEAFHFMHLPHCWSMLVAGQRWKS